MTEEPLESEELLEPEEPFDPEVRRYPSTIGGALIFAALVRLVLRARDAGMLAVRHKLLDAVILLVLGGALIFLATSIPDQPGF